MSLLIGISNLTSSVNVYCRWDTDSPFTFLNPS